MTPKTSEVRKAIPMRVKLAVLASQARCAVCGEKLGSLADLQFDHRPPLVAREWNAEAGDYIPPQNDPEAMQAVHSDCHLYRTTGRKPGATKKTSLGDMGEAAKSRRIQEQQEAFRRRLLAKDQGESKPPSRWPKRKMQSRCAGGDARRAAKDMRTTGFRGSRGIRSGSTKTGRQERPRRFGSG